MSDIFIAKCPETVTMTYNDANCLVTWNGQKVRYDEKGNMTYGPVDGVMQELTYDCRNLLMEADGISYTYDAENTRIATTEDGLAPGRKKPLNFEDRATLIPIGPKKKIY